METDYNNPEEEKLRILGKIFLGAVFLALPLFYVSYFMQEKKITNQLEECSFYTVAVPISITVKQKLSYRFLIHGEWQNDYVRASADDLGYFYTRKQVLNSRFWVRVYCKDFKVNRIYWEAKVPDTLQYIAPNGWEEIPYGLGEK